VLLVVAVIVAVSASLATNEGSSIALAAGNDMSGVEPPSQPSFPNQSLVSSPSLAPTFPPNFRAGRTRAPSTSRTQLFWQAPEGVPSASPSS
jgi:hypothetical protein